MSEQSAFSKAVSVNPVDGIWCSVCGWAGRVEEDMTDSDESEEPLFEDFCECIPRFCPNCGTRMRAIRIYMREGKELED